MSDKMPKKPFAISFSLLLLLAVASCNNSSFGTTDSKKPLEDFRTGSNGIEMKFVKLPNRVYAEDDVYDNEELQVDIEVWNRGAFPQPDSEFNQFVGDVYLSGYDKTIVQIDPISAHKDMDSTLLGGKTTYNKEGDREIMHFSGDIDLAGKNIDKYEPTIMATACYDYKTTGNFPVCIDPDPYGLTSEEKVCSISSSYTVGGGTQGAPVAITRVEEEMMSNRVQFRIYIKNIQKGDVIQYGLLEDCNPYLNKLRYSDLDKVYLEQVEVSGHDISYNCRPKDRYIRLINGEGIIACDYTSSEGFDREAPSYIAPLVVRIAYVYRNTISQKLTIVRTSIS